MSADIERITADDDYPELAQIHRGTGVTFLEDAEEQAGRALNEIDHMRGITHDLLAEVDWLRDLIRQAHRMSPDEWMSCTCGTELSCATCDDKGMVGDDNCPSCSDEEGCTAIHAAHIDALLAATRPPEEKE